MGELRFVVWAAVSSLPQAQRISISDQIKAAMEHVARHSGRVTAELVVPGESRSIILFEDACRQIPAYARLRDLIDQQAFDWLIYLDRSRLGRKATLSMAVVELCHSAGIGTYEMENPPTRLEFNPTGHDDMLLGAIKSVGAQREVEKLRDRHRMGMLGRAKRGLPANRIWYGYRYEGPDRQIVLHEEQAEVVRKIFDWYVNHGWGRTKIMQELHERGIPAAKGGPWNDGTLAYVIRRRWIYAGYAEYNRFSKTGRPLARYPGTWPAIIDEETADLVDQEMQHRRNRGRAVQSSRFSALARCGYCDGPIVSSGYERNGERKFRCGQRCAGTYIPEHRIMSVLTHEIEDLAKTVDMDEIDQSAIVDDRDRIVTERNEAEAGLQRIVDQRKRLTRLALADTIDEAEYESLMAELHDRRTRIEARIQHLSDQLADTNRQSRRRQRLLTAAEIGLSMLNHPDVATANAWLRQHLTLYIAENQVAAVVWK